MRYEIKTTTQLCWAMTATLLIGLTSQLVAQESEAQNSRKSGPAKPAPISDSPTEDLVFLEADHPVFVRLFAYIDGREIRATRIDRIAKTLAELDDNKDGAIDQAEQKAHPRAFRSLGIPEKWNNLLPLVDRKPKDERVSQEEIALLLESRFGPTVTLAGRVRRGNQAVELFELLDADRDQRLTESELAAMPVRLHKLDADGDDAFSVVEVEPFRNPFGASPNAMTSRDDLPWAVAKTAGERLLDRFDVAPKDQALSPMELGQPEQAIATADADHSGALSLAELTQWLPTVAPQAILISNSFKRKAGRTEVIWEDLMADAERPAGKSNRQVAKNLELKLAGLPFQVQITSAARGLETDTISFYRNQFRRADADKNKYLDKTEYVQLSALGASFEMLDVDDNEQIYEPELVDYLSLETSSEQSRVILSFDRNEQSLFSLLDRNSDRRLTAREALSTFERWQSFDHDGDHVLNRSELSGRMRMTVELPKPKLFQQDFNQQGAMSRDPVIPAQSDGPLWFQGMDRNRDGDISRREFLGTEPQFRKWDRDGDGLISKQESLP